VGALGVYSRPTVPRPVNTGDSHLCNRPIAVPDRPNCPKGSWVQGSEGGGAGSGGVAPTWRFGVQRERVAGRKRAFAADSCR